MSTRSYLKRLIHWAMDRFRATRSPSPPASVAPSQTSRDKAGLVRHKGAPLTGQLVQRNTKTGQPLIRCGYANGLRHGSSLFWDNEGRLLELAQFHRGRLHGKRIIWHSNGCVQSEATYINGEASGLLLRWNEAGELIERAPAATWQQLSQDLHTNW